MEKKGSSQVVGKSHSVEEMASWNKHQSQEMIERGKAEKPRKNLSEKKTFHR